MRPRGRNCIRYGWRRNRFLIHVYAYVHVRHSQVNSAYSYLGWLGGFVRRSCIVARFLRVTASALSVYDKHDKVTL